MNLYEQVRHLLNYDSETGVFTWRIDRSRYKAGTVAGYVSEYGYIKTRMFGKEYFMHRLAWLYVYGRLPALTIDHIDGNKLNNRISNLREATFGENMQNSSLRRNNKSGIIGVYFCNQKKKWRSQIQVNKKRYHLGLFNTVEEATKAYLEAKKELHTFSPIPR